MKKLPRFQQRDFWILNRILLRFVHGTQQTQKEKMRFFSHFIIIRMLISGMSLSYIGDSLGLAQQAEDTSIIVLQGSFHGRTANSESGKEYCYLILRAGCSLADTYEA